VWIHIHRKKAPAMAGKRPTGTGTGRPLSNKHIIPSFLSIYTYEHLPVRPSLTKNLKKKTRRDELLETGQKFGGNKQGGCMINRVEL
jgi:hypothetical protein